jgi:hypothetical protein
LTSHAIIAAQQPPAQRNSGNKQCGRQTGRKASRDPDVRQTGHQCCHQQQMQTPPQAVWQARGKRGRQTQHEANQPNSARLIQKIQAKRRQVIPITDINSNNYIGITY